MLPDIRAILAAIVAAIGLLAVAFGVVATFRVAQESRAGSLQADLAQRSHVARPEPQPIVVIETPGPTLLAKAPPIEPPAPAMAEPAIAATEPPATEKNEAAQLLAATTIPDDPPIGSAPAEPDADSQPTAIAVAPAQNVPLPSAIEALPDPPVMATVAAAVPQPMETQPEPLSPVVVGGIGGPSPEEIAQAKAQRKAGERARAKKAAAEKAKKMRAARIAREKAAAKRAAEARAKQQAASSSPQGGFGVYPTGAFNSAPFGNSTFTIGGATGQR